jgi:alkylresorcinol/alkylpyrone synthase
MPARIASTGIYDGPKTNIDDCLATVQHTFSNKDLLDKGSKNPGIDTKQVHPHQEPFSLALTMCIEACEQALSSWNKPRQEITSMIFVTSTLLRAPTLEISLLSKLGLSADTHRIPLVLGGCAAAPIALRTASDIAQCGGKCLVVCMDIASPHIHRKCEEDICTAIASVIFSDGAAACIVDDEQSGAQILSSASYTAPNTEDKMQLRMSSAEQGFGALYPVLDKQVHVLAAKNVPKVLQHLACQEQPTTYLFHTGGRTILEELEKTFAPIEFSKDVLRRYGNMSSPSCLYALHNARQAGIKGECPLIAFGQGVHVCGVRICL